MYERRKDSAGPICPSCGGREIWKSGFGRGKQQYKCRACGRVFILDLRLDPLVIEIADRMLRENLSVVVVARILDGLVSRRWVYYRRRMVCGTS